MPGNHPASTSKVHDFRVQTTCSGDSRRAPANQWRLRLRPHEVAARKQLRAAQTIAILPRHRRRRSARLNSCRGRGNHLRFVIERGRWRVRGWRWPDGSRSAAAQHARRFHHAHLNPGLRLVFQIRGQLSANGQRSRELRPHCSNTLISSRTSPSRLRHGVVLLRRQGQHIRAVFERALNQRLAFEMAFAALRRPAHVFVELHRELHRPRAARRTFQAAASDAGKRWRSMFFPRHRSMLRAAFHAASVRRKLPRGDNRSATQAPKRACQASGNRGG